MKMQRSDSRTNIIRGTHQARPWRRPTIGLMGLAVLAISAQAQAQVKLTWDASRCLPADRDVSGVVATPPNPKTKPPTPGQIKNGSSTPQIVHCPIIRTTSGPGFTDDYLLGADVPVQVPAGKSVSCFASAWSTLIADSQTGNLVEVTPAISGTTVVHVPGLFNTSGYWYGGNPPSGPAKWFYADLSCTLPPQAILKDYQVTEEGADAGYRIYPSTNCSVDGSNTILWEYINSAVEHGTEGGYIRGQSSHDAANFAMNCPVSNNRVVNFAVSWGGALNLTGCNLNNTDFSRWTWSAVADPQGSAWPTEILPVNPGNPAEPFMTIPLVGTYQLNCGVNGTVGDGKLLSYRSAVQPDRSAWAVSSSTGGVPSGPVTISDAR